MPDRRLLMIMPHQTLPPRSQRLRDWAARRGFALEGICWDRREDGAGPDTFRGQADEPWTVVHRGGGEKSWTLGLHYPLWARAVYRAVRQRRPDVVLAFDLDAAIGCVPAKRALGFDLVYDVADTFYLRHNFPWPIERALQAFERVVLRAADVVFVPDETRVTPLEEAFRGKLTVVYNCPSRDATRGVDASTAREPGTFLLSGYLTPERGCHVVLDALERVPTARLIVAGQVSDERLRQRLLTQPRVEFLGHLSHAQSMTTFARSLAVFTLYDPRIEINRRAASNKWYDAMLTATPVIANEELVAARWIRETGFGELVPYGDVDALAACLRRMADDPAGAMAKGAAGRRLFDTEFNWERMEQRLDAAFERARIGVRTGSR